MEFLLAQISGANVPTARLAAAEILTSARLNPAQTIALLKTVRADPVIAPGSILDAVQRSGLEPDTAAALLDYVAASLDAGWTFSAEQLAKVQAAIPENQRATAAALITRLAQAADRQRQQLTDFSPLLNAGDAVRGEKIFFEKGQCITCHRIWENGGRVGPDLSRIGAIRSGRDILESVLIPSATIAQGYNTLNVTTTDGETYTGVRVGTTENPLHLRLVSGTEMVFHSSQIERVDRSKVSLMPEGLLNNLTRDEARDLLAFLQLLK
jgi:putative heme-binding domain-containing protein